MPRFSVIVPVYNRAATVLPTLQSVRDQTFTDFECIVVDDGSKDGEELQSVVESLGDARFRCVRRENGGGGAARNTGIDESRGEFVALLDSDDYWLPEKLERDASACARDRVIFSPMLVQRGGRNFGRRPRFGLEAREPIGDYLMRRGGFVPTSTITVPSALARRVRYDETIRFGQDTDFALRLFHAGAQFHMLAEPQSVMNDEETGERLSRSKDWQAALAWLDRTRPALTDRAYLAYRGSQVARMAAESGRYQTALYFYGAALSRGAFSPIVAAKALGQLLLRRSLYRRLTS